MSLTLPPRAVLGRELMVANTPGFSKHSLTHWRDIKKPTGELFGRAQSTVPETHPHESSPHAPLGTKAGMKVYLTSTTVQPPQGGSGKVFLPVTHPVHRKSDANTKPLPAQSLALWPGPALPKGWAVSGNLWLSLDTFCWHSAAHKDEILPLNFEKHVLAAKSGC